MEACGLDLARGRDGMVGCGDGEEVGTGVVLAGSAEISPWLESSGFELGGSQGWECREPFYRRLDGGSLNRGLLHGSPRWILIKRGSPWF